MSDTPIPDTTAPGATFTPSDEVYTFDNYKIPIRLMLMPNDQDPAGRRVWIGVRKEEGDLLLIAGKLSGCSCATPGRRGVGVTHTTSPRTNRGT